MRSGNKIEKESGLYITAKFVLRSEERKSDRGTQAYISSAGFVLRSEGWKSSRERERERERERVRLLYYQLCFH